MINKVYSYFYNLINSVFFPFIMTFFSAIFFVLGIQNVAFITITVVGCLILILQKSTTPIFALVLAFIISIREQDGLTNLAFVIPLFSPAVVSIIYHFIRYRVKLKIGSLTLPFILIGCVGFFGGIGSEYRQYFNQGIVYILTISLVPLVVYTFFYSTLENSKKDNIKKYLAFSLIAVCIAVGIETIALLTNSYKSIVNNGYVGTCEIGWLNTGFASYFHLLSFGASFYLMTKYKNVFLPFLMIVFSIIITFYAKSDGAFGTMVILLPFALILFYFRVDNSKKQQILILAIALLVVLILCLVLFISESSFFDYVSKHFLSDTGRSTIYKDGLVLFKSNPIFGGSFGAVYHINNIFAEASGYIHSTLLQVLYCMGIVGLLVYVFYFYKRIRIFTQNSTDFNFYMFVSFLAFECYAMIDCAEFSFLTVVITILTACVEVINKSNPEDELPLYKQCI